MSSSPLLRPSPERIQSAWRELFADPLVSPDRLKAAALSTEGIRGEHAEGVMLRSVYWRFYHSLLPSPTAPHLIPHHVHSLRQSYAALRERYLLAPDGRWASDCSPPISSSTSPRPTTPDPYPPRPPTSSHGWDPLNLSEASPWKTWFAHLDMRAEIRKDVERTFPDLPYFEDEEVRKGMVTALFLWAVLNPDVGYRQGMHELLAVCYLSVDLDSLDVASLPRASSPPLSPDADGAERDLAEAMRTTLDRRYVEYDAFALFQSIMKAGKAFYEWRSEEGPRSKTPSAVKAPIIERCNRLHNDMIRRIDPQLWERLETKGVEAQIWAIRWIRLIFTRELPFAIALRLWDGVFAEDPGLGILDAICMAMLLLIRNELLEADYPTLLTKLLHYPSPSDVYPFDPQLILSQAIFLRDNATPAAGVHVVLQNQEMLGIRAQPPEQDEAEAARRIHRGPPTRGGRGMRGRPSPMARPSGMQGIAAGLFERAQAAGLDKAILSTVNDLRKNLPDGATAYSYLPNLPFSPIQSPSQYRDGSFSSIPTSTSPALFHRPPAALPEARPAIPHRPSVDSNISIKSVKDAEREIAELRLAMMGMGKAMAEWLETVRAPVDESEPESGDKREVAWQGLERVKETLLEGATWDVEEVVRRWAWHEGLEAPRSRGPTPVPAPAETDSTAGDPQYATLYETSGNEDMTPTAPDVSILPPTPNLPVVTSDASSAYQSNFNRPRPLNLVRSAVHPDRVASPIRSPLDNPGRGSVSSRSNGLAKNAEPDNGDPLAGIGAQAWTRAGGGKETVKRGGADGRGGGSVDPLLGVGVR